MTNSKKVNLLSLWFKVVIYERTFQIRVKRFMYCYYKLCFFIHFCKHPFYRSEGNFTGTCKINNWYRSSEIIVKNKTAQKSVRQLSKINDTLKFAPNSMLIWRTSIINVSNEISMWRFLPLRHYHTKSVTMYVSDTNTMS